MTGRDDGVNGGDATPGAVGSLADAAFWDGYWGRFALPNAIDETRSFDRTLARALRALVRGTSGSVLEVGCAPGRWLAFLSTEFGLHASGIEYTAAGAQATRRNLDLLGVPYADIREADFFSTLPRPVYDVVVSLGFVEHFTDVRGVIARHGGWVRSGGLLVVGVPNFVGLHGWFQRMLDPDILRRHNLTIMHPDRLTALGVEAGLRAESARYLGSFEPSLPIARPGVRGPMEFVAKAALRVARLVRRAPLVGPALDGWNGPWVSSYILASFRKPG